MPAWVRFDLKSTDMQIASLAEIKRQLKTMNQEEVMALCLRLARFKKDNKELLNYLLFESHNEDAYILSVQNYIADSMTEINTGNLYFIKKGLRKILRTTNKMIRYSGKKQTEIEVLIYFCQSMNQAPFDYKRSNVLSNLYERQISKIRKAMLHIHEDLQADYELELASLS